MSGEGGLTCMGNPLCVHREKTYWEVQFHGISERHRHPFFAEGTTGLVEGVARDRKSKKEKKTDQQFLTALISIAIGNDMQNSFPERN